MSFGKRSTPPNKTPSQTRSTQPVPTNINDLRTEADNEDQHPLIIPVLAAITLTLGVGVVLQLSNFKLPSFSYRATSITYGIGERVRSFSIPIKTVKEQEYLEKVKGVDFSLILTPPAEETTPAMKRVAEECLPRRRYKRRVLPFYTSTTFEQATAYLNCAMSFNMDRLCKLKERKRLVQQLFQYLDVRQSVWGAKNAVISYHKEHKKIDNLKTAYQVLSNRSNIRKLALERASMAGMYMGRFTNRKPRYTNQGSYKKAENYLSRRKGDIDAIIDDKIDTGIANHLKTLIQQGYLSTKDFGWYGLILPSEYAPYINGSVVGEDKCAGNRT